MTATQIKSTISESTISDVRFAFDSTENTLDGEWIYGVDPESMQEVKNLWNLMDGSKSLYNAFCAVLKYSRKNNITIWS